MTPAHCTCRALLLITPVIMFAPSPPLSAAQATDLRRIEQRVGDVGPLSISLRTMSLDLQVPVDFEHVRQLPGRRDQLVRSSGALHAVFSRSWYLDTPQGALALVPPGTIFRIGSESLSHALAAPYPHSQGAGDSEHRPRGGMHGATSAASADQRGLWTGATPLEAQFQSRVHGAFMPPLRHDLPDVPRRKDSNPEDAGPRIAVDSDYRRHRFNALRDRALEHQAARGPSSPSSK